MSVFKIDKDFRIILNKDAVKLVPELSSLNENELKYVILVMDYVDGPFRRLPIDERRDLARKKIYGNLKVNPESEKVKVAMEAYKGLVFDIRRETIDIYNKKIHQLQKETLSDISINKIKEYDQSITFLQTRVETLLHDLDMEEDKEMQLRGDREISYIEIWQLRQKKLHEFQENR
jgi:hypothetical protein